ncbi:MAG: tetratricopeptide repeat protein [Candidatus Acidiferrales bacterium]
MDLPAMNPVARREWFRRDISVAWLALVAVVTMASAGGCRKLESRDQLNKGVEAYRNQQYDVAIEDFKQAKDLDPTLISARLYLATAYASLYVPGAPSPDNLRMGKQAVAEFQDVLTVDPGNLSAIDGIGSMLFQMAAGPPFNADMFKESESYHLKHIQLKPEDPEPYYWVGVIDWTLSFRANSEIRAKYNQENPRKQIHDDQPLPPNLRQQYSQDYGPMVDDGIAQLQKAIVLRPDYDDAMAYLNLLLRRKADQVNDMNERTALQKQADDLVDKVKDIKQQKAAAAANASPS